MTGPVPASLGACGSGSVTGAGATTTGAGAWMGTAGAAGAGATGASTGAAGATGTVTVPGADVVAAGSGEGAVVTVAAGVAVSVGVAVVAVGVGVVSAFAVATKPKVRPPTSRTAAPPPIAARAVFVSMLTAYPSTHQIKTTSSNEFTKPYLPDPAARPDANQSMKEPHRMSNQDMNEAMPVDEQTAEQKKVLAHHFALIEHMRQQLEMIKSTPEGVTHDVVTFYEDALDAQRQWMASHGFHFPAGESGGQ